MLFLISWIIYGLIVGVIAKAASSKEGLPVGWLGTLGIGVAGSYVGGIICWILGSGGSPFSPSGIFMGIIGGIVFCWLYRKYHLNRFLEAQKIKESKEELELELFQMEERDAL